MFRIIFLFRMGKGGKDGNALFGAQGITSGRHQGGIREEFLVCAYPSLTPEFLPRERSIIIYGIDLRLQRTPF